MRNWIKEWGVVVAVGLTMGLFLGVQALPALAAGALNERNAKANKATPIVSPLMNAVGNYPSSGGYGNPNGKSEKMDCSIVATGTNTMSFWVQTSREGSIWVNATTASLDVNPGNSETLSFTGDVVGKNEIRFRTADADVDVTNTAIFTCDFWR